MRELHHRVENNFTVLASILGLQSTQSKSQEAQEIAREGESRLHAMNLLHKKLYWQDEMASIPLDGYIREVVNQSKSVYANQRVESDLQLVPVELDINKAIPLGLIINELITNSYKHAFASHPNPRLMVSLAKEGDELIIILQDNGMVNTEEKTTSPSFGMTLVQTLVRQVKGSISRMASEGTSYEIRVSTG